MKTKDYISVAITLLTSLFSISSGMGQAGALVPEQSAVFTATNEVSSLAVEADGTLWVGTMGGVLRRDARGVWRRWTRLEGLPAHETRRVALEKGKVVATFPTATARWQGGRWVTTGRTAFAHSNKAPLVCTTTWNGNECIAGLTELHISRGWHGRSFPLPNSRGTHVSVLLPHGKTLWAALFGDGIWAFDGKGWQAVDLHMPAEAREITAMTMGRDTLWIGTRRAGVWGYTHGVWTPYRPFDTPYNHNVQAFAVYRDRLYISTLEDGLVIRTNQGWQQVTVPLLSSVAPRQLAVFRDALYVRHGNGAVDRLEGEIWTRDVCRWLPRKGSTALAADSQRLYVGQWGGWSEFDGRNWTHYFTQKALQTCPLTVLCPQGDTLWIGTQNRGLARYDHRTGQLGWFDERQGLRDDWITALMSDGKGLCVGTFVGGMIRWDGRHWCGSALRGENVTAFAEDGKGGAWVATRTGLWRRTQNGRILRMHIPFLESEVQALLPIRGGIWVGTRTGIFYIASSTASGMGKTTVTRPPPSGRTP